MAGSRLGHSGAIQIPNHSITTHPLFLPTRPKKLGSQFKANLKLWDSEVYPTNRGISRIIEEKPVVAIIPD